MDNPIVIYNFNFCPLTQSPTLGMGCLECEHIKKVAEEYFCICEDDENQDDLSVKEIINMLVDLLAAGHLTVNRDEIIKIIEAM